ncbi:hypothetical protein AK812_SmicGene46158, partial [Symbiodinium microadriaticum]
TCRPTPRKRNCGKDCSRPCIVPWATTSRRCATP